MGFTFDGSLRTYMEYIMYLVTHTRHFSQPCEKNCLLHKTKKKCLTETHHVSAWAIVECKNLDIFQFLPG